MSQRRYTLSLSCPDRVGIVAAVSGLIASCKGWILEASYHADAVTRWFFMRQEILAESLSIDIDEFRGRFAALAKEFDMNWRLSDSAVKKRIALFVSRQDHCLSDLLYRWRNQEFDFDIVCVISNHPALRGFVEFHQIPYYHVPITPENKVRSFGRMEDLVNEHRADAIVLARYMQILPRGFCDRFDGRIINIHHSFLPSFLGGRPYHQAYERGVKLIGATCHYVTGDLDAGPIIDQDVIRVDHSDAVEDMMRLGRDVEKTVLARGLRYHVQERVLIHQNKTIVFD
ncbi:MAG: formyltetrahydrofolate deformylase [Phycisphaerales bacterium]|jgi:formyltetrahydrofolate deformylase|nr:formyltetrahydrofolate deformylase [Phycisphaerales bacterium]